LAGVKGNHLVTGSLPGAFSSLATAVRLPAHERDAPAEVHRDPATPPRPGLRPAHDENPSKVNPLQPLHLAAGLLVLEGMELPLLRVAVLSRAEAQAQRLASQLAGARVEAAAFALDAPEPSPAQLSPGLLVVSLDGVDVRSAIRLASARAPGCPLLLVGELPWPPGWLQAFAVGVVGVVRPEALDAAVVTFLHASLPGRPGAIRGSGVFWELPGFLDSLEALGRTGTLVVTSVTQGVGRVEFDAGEATLARFGLRSGQEAWTALRACQGSWSFREHAGSAAPADPLPELDARSVRVLLVHEDSATLAARADHLARQGFQVVSAHGPAEALQALAVGPFEAAVLDVAEAAEVRRRLASDLRSRETHQVVAARTGEPSRGGLPAGASPAQVEAAVRAGLAPRAEAQARLRSWQLDESVSFEVDAVGLQWLVRQLEAVAVTGTLELRGAGGEVAQVWFIDGRLCQATRGGAWGAEALAPLLIARGVTALLEVAGLPEGEGFAGAPTGAVLEALVARAEDLVRGPGTAATVHASGVYRAA
jgi:hypothetical protein